MKPLYSILLLLSLGCASVMNPEGGDKDIDPPLILKTSPDSAALNVFPKQIVLTLDEYFTVQNPTKEWTISPAPNKFPEYKIKGKSLEINILDTLSPSTTYAIHFGKSIADINEGNVLKDYRFLFSTGNSIDSMEIHGSVVQAKSAQPMKEMTVFLKDTTIPITEAKTLYRIQTDEQGNFHFKNLAHRPYQIFAIEDKNNNKSADKDESVAFMTSKIFPDSTPLELYSFVPSYGNQGITTSRSVISGIYTFTFNHPTYYYPVTVTPADTSVKYRTYSNDQKDTLTLVYPIRSDQPASFKVAMSDTQFLITVKTIPVSDTLKLISKTRLGNQTKISYDQPLKQINNELLELWSDSVRLKIQKEQFSLDQNHLIFQSGASSDKTLKFIIPPGAIQSVFNASPVQSDTLLIEPETTSKTGSLQFSIQDTFRTSTVIELIKEFKTIQSVTCNPCKSVSFKNIQPDVYQIRILYDENNNGVIDKGDLKLWRLPERSLILPQTYKVKPDWQQTDIQLFIPQFTTPSTPR